MPHLLVDISYHGFGHISQTAPVVNLLAQQIPSLQVTLRTTAPLAILQQRFQCRFTHIPQAFDFGMTMANAVDVLVEESALRYKTFHEGWDEKVSQEAIAMRAIAPDLLLANIPYLSLAAADAAKIPAVALCSLNWADIYQHYCAQSGDRVLSQMLKAYNSATKFLQPQPSMAMPNFTNTLAVNPIAKVGSNRRVEIDSRLSNKQEKLVLVAMGGMEFRLPIERWGVIPNVRWVVPKVWDVTRNDVSDFEEFDLSFSDLLASCDAVLTKPGYGTFTEAACAGVPVLYVAREDWPEEPYLVAWLGENTACIEVSRSEVSTGDLEEKLRQLWKMARPRQPSPTGAEEAAALLKKALTGEVE